MARFVLSSKGLFLALAVALLWQGRVTDSRACQYCRLAATDPEAARMAAQMHSGGFPLDGTISQFQSAVPAAILTAPPAPDSVVTNPADLPPMPGRLHEAAIPVAPVMVPVRAAAVPEVAGRPPGTPLRWADVGLLGLVGMGGWFYWRTRRVSAPVA